MPSAQEKSISAILEELQDDIDVTTFEQILEMDDEDDREFSRTLVFEFLTQGEETFAKIEKSIAEKDLEALSHQGHYLKGSSATLGLVKIQASCEKIQRYGLKENVDGSPEPDEALCLSRIVDTLKVLRVDFAGVKKAMKKIYNYEEEEEEEEEEEDEDEEEDEEGEDVDKGVAAPEDAEGAEDTEDTERTEDTKDTKAAKESTEAITADKTKAAASSETRAIGTA
ncbi:related to multistep phosphorelay regulator 1 [Cephalotrichum gorgonifer]|uniref:Related to multistep phosphorelay regulator 1 n=1 Tax=Cephalotrichum gorgonifer TaxID=2041049 RepID=A0AAE8MZB9_9PEZI|nr:related to multistep phosphorelay regulator 1 [Cephalotrichum gorgonifer]